MSWLPPRRTRAQQERSPWRPPTLGRAKTDDLRYLVVEEIVGSSIGLALSPWPQTDSEGRLRFAQDDALTFGVDRDSFARYLAKHRRPRALRRRPLRIGDVFAVKVDEPALRQVAGQLEERTSLQPLLNPDNWLRSPVYDITADAREVAKASFYAAVTEPLNPVQAASIRELIDPERAARAFSLPGRLRPSLGTPAGAIIGMTVLALAGLGAGTALGRQTTGKHTVSVAATTRVLTRTRFHTTTISKTITKAAQTTRVVVNHTTTETTPRQVTLTVTLTGDAPGTVSVDPTGPDCTKTSASEQTCKYQLPAGTPVTLTATTSALFGGWGIKDCTAKTTTCLVNPGESLAVTANFYELR
jgi:hypothetical protein